MDNDEKEMWTWIVAIALYGVVLQVSASSVATGKIGNGPDPQFISVQPELKAVKLPTFSTSSGRKLVRCPGETPVWSFECQPVKGDHFENR